MRRGSRKRKADQKREDKRHQEMLEAIKNRDNEKNQKDT
jgi:DNA-binding GntR family transcriptional regulator